MSRQNPTQRERRDRVWETVDAEAAEKAATAAAQATTAEAQLSIEEKKRRRSGFSLTLATGGYLGNTVANAGAPISTPKLGGG